MRVICLWELFVCGRQANAGKCGSISLGMLASIAISSISEEIYSDTIVSLYEYTGESIVFEKDSSFA